MQENDKNLPNTAEAAAAGEKTNPALINREKLNITAETGIEEMNE